MFSKMSRQLIIFHIFLYSRVVEMGEIKELLKISSKTIMRDLSELQNAGILRVQYSKDEKGYVHLHNQNRCPFLEPVFSTNEARNRHLDRLRRLAATMIDLNGHIEFPYYDDRAKNQETCSSWYKKRFPHVSKRTMQRDFAELNKIGYEIEYDRSEQIYVVDFPEGLEGIEIRLGDGSAVFK